MSASKDNEVEVSGREVVNVRIFDAPRDVVFNTFSDADHLAQWWGPRGFTNTFHRFEFRPGGLWRFVMHSPRGADYPNESVFVEIVEPERIVFRHLKPIHEFRMTITFDEQNGKTRLTWRMLSTRPLNAQGSEHLPLQRTSRTLTASSRTWPRWLEVAEIGRKAMS